MSYGTRILDALGRLFRSSSGRNTAANRPHAPGVVPEHQGEGATVEVAPPPRGGLRITYDPSLDGDPDAGEIVWTWVPFAENDGRGKDRPVLVIGRHGTERVFAVRLTSTSHDGDRDFLALGGGPWDAQQRPSWADLRQLYSVHRDGMRREASALDLNRFSRVAEALSARYGWVVEG